jgi:hypothetical protein
MKAGELYFLKDHFFYSDMPPLKKGTPVMILSVRGNLLDLLIEDKKYIWDIWMFEEAVEKYNDQH